MVEEVAATAPPRVQVQGGLVEVLGHQLKMFTVEVVVLLVKDMLVGQITRRAFSIQLQAVVELQK